MRPAVEAVGCLNAVADDPAAALLAGRRQRMDRALEAVKDVSSVAAQQLEGLVVVVAAHFAFAITNLLCRAPAATLVVGRHADIRTGPGPQVESSTDVGALRGL